MKILIYTHEFPPVTGGAGIYAYNIADGLSKIGNDICMLGPSQKGDKNFDKKINIKIVRKNIYKTSVENVKNSLFQTIDEFKPECILIADSNAQFYASHFQERLKEYDYFITVHGTELYRFFIHTIKNNKIKDYYLAIDLYKNAKGLIAISNATKNKVNKIVPQFKNKLSTVLHGINLKIFHEISKEEMKEMKDKFKITNNEKIILNCSRLWKNKGHFILLKAFKEVLKTHQNLKLFIVGEGLLEEEIKINISKLSLGKKVIMSGNVPYQLMYKYYGLCDIFIMVSQREKISNYESFGLVFLEANACGKAVIGGDIGGVSEAIENGKSGILVDPWDQANISDAIIYLLTNSQKRNKIGKYGKERVMKHFNNVIMAKNTFKILNNTLKV